MASTIKADTLQSTTSNVFVLNSAGTEYMRFDSSGNIGAGITSGFPGKFNWYGGHTYIANSTSANMYVYETSVGPQLRLKADTTNVGIGPINSYPFLFLMGNGEVARFDTSGNFKLSSAGTKVLNSSGNPILQQTGSVLQVVNGTTTSSGSSASTTVVDTGLTATITPTSASSKILVLVSQRFFKTQACSAGGTVYLQRGATNLLTDQRVCLNDTTSVGGDQTWSCCYLDSPATTSATTYKTQFGNTNTSGFFYVNLDGNQAQITLLEISA